MKPRRRNAPRARLTFSRLAPTIPARSRWVRCSEIRVPPSGSARPWSAARPSRTLASRLLTSSDSRSSIRASRAASRAATWRSRAEEAGGLDSRKPQKASRPIAQAVVDEFAAAADGGDDRHLAGGQDQHVVGRFALAHQEAAHRVVERGGPGDQGRQGAGLAVAEDRALAQDLEQRRLVGRRSPSGHVPTRPVWRRRRTSAWAPMVVAW